MPVEDHELDDRIEVRSDYVRLRSYGLPMIFWGYLAAAAGVMFFMGLAIEDPIKKILMSDDVINHFLALCVISIFTLGPLIALGFYFYEKEICKNGNNIKVTHKVFFIPVKSHQFIINDENPLELIHFLDSPNVAKLEKRQGMTGFENRGYFQVFAYNVQGKKTLIDRNSRKGEMKKLMALLS